MVRRNERTIPYLFRICAILAAFQVVVFLIALEELSWKQMDVYSQLSEGPKNLIPVKITVNAQKLSGNFPMAGQHAPGRLDHVRPRSGDRQ